MSLYRRLVMMILVVLAVAIVSGSQSAMAQGAAEGAIAQRDKDDETNLDTQLFLIVATNQDVDDAKVPAVLDSVVKQLRASLPYKNYRLAATLINRVKNEGRLNLKWIGGPLTTGATATNISPSYNEFRVNAVKVTRDPSGQPVVRMEGFGFNARIQIQQATAVAATGPSSPIISYESTGLNTDFSMREGQPVIVGTLNVGPSGDAIILVMSARRTNK